MTEIEDMFELTRCRWGCEESMSLHINHTKTKFCEQTKIRLENSWLINMHSDISFVSPINYNTQQQFCSNYYPHQYTVTFHPN